MPRKFLELVGERILKEPPKRVIVSGPSGFLGRRVVDGLVQVQQYRIEHGIDPGEIVLLSSRPGFLMGGLSQQYGREVLRHMRASRVDYYDQHGVEMWHDHLGSLGLGGTDCVFMNIAGVAGPITGRSDAMRDVNYKAPIAAAEACIRLKFGHWIQASTQATQAERGGQVPYSRWNAMIDYGLSRIRFTGLPVSICFLGLLYAADEGLVGQRGNAFNLADTVNFPLCPIIGDGSAPLQPQEVNDASARLVLLASTDPAERTLDPKAYRPPGDATLTVEGGVVQSDTPQNPYRRKGGTPPHRNGLRTYDAVGPETMSIYQMMSRFAYYQNCTFRPVFIDYRRMEQLLNIKPLGNLNRQFVSLLRSEQQSENPAIGNPSCWEALLGPNAKLKKLDESFLDLHGKPKLKSKRWPYLILFQWAWQDLKVIPPGILVLMELCWAYARRGTKPPANRENTLGAIEPSKSKEERQERP